MIIVLIIRREVSAGLMVSVVILVISLRVMLRVNLRIIT